MELKGAYKGVKEFKLMKNPDIKSSVVDGKRYQKNKLTIVKRGQDSYVIYHSYDSADKHGGRWYDVSSPRSDIKLDATKRQMTRILPEYEIWGTEHVKVNVPVTINFTQKGWKRLMKFLEK